MRMLLQEKIADHVQKEETIEAQEEMTKDNFYLKIKNPNLSY
jgi:hypothetical protein